MSGRAQYSKRTRAATGVCKRCHRRIRAGLLFAGLCRRCRALTAQEPPVKNS